MSKIALINKEEFDLMPNNEKIVAICKDVLARMDADLIVANQGKIFEIPNMWEEEVNAPKDFFNKKTCKVCAKGGILASWIGNFNNFSWRQIERLDNYTERAYFADDVPHELIEIFGQLMLDKIEVAFEGECFGWNDADAEDFEEMFPEVRDQDDDESEDCYDDYLEIEQNYRLRTIMKNIIKNKGEFILETK